MTTIFSHEPDASRYAMHIDGQLVAVVDYRLTETSISFTRTFTAPTMRGNGFAEKVVTFAADDVEQNSSRRVVPMCWYVGDWFERHPERAGLLTR